ncbi:hypothetical protein Pan44_25180 [Caulifigura coniformis]|uniref:Glycosyl transferases group 1 n=1 Tax=Caulifigura coniformis TaxID=2527983 RepID=A0A517SEC6_9PLAN|nr:glycosyltransferase [Caulifigura coniformis]QDT54485.1 hypothetical protein Pan44_25180 [Caulifigura coniformis]
MQLLETVSAESPSTKSPSQCDVLLLMRGQHHDQPQKSKVPILRLAKAGVTMQVRQVPEDPAAYLEKFQPRILLIGMLCLKPEVVRDLAQRYPQTHFVAVNHSALSHCILAEGLLQKHLDFVQLSKDLSNCWLASPDPRNFPAAHGHPRIVCLPNTCMHLRPAPPVRPIPEVMSAAIICRRDAIKNIPDQISALAIANRVRPFRLLLGVGGTPAQVKTLLDLAASMDLDAEPIGIQPWKDYIRTLETRVDILLHASFTETFCFNAWEAAGRGVPVVCSPAVQWAPQEWCANPSDPRDIARTTLFLAHQLTIRGRSLRERCRKVAQEIGDKNDALYVQTLLRIMATG